MKALSPRVRAIFVNWNDPDASALVFRPSVSSYTVALGSVEPRSVTLAAFVV